MPVSGSAATGSYGAVSIGTTAALIVAANSRRCSVLIQNAHASQDLYIGLDDDVETTTGVKVAAGGSISFDDYRGDLYGIASGASTDVRYIEPGSA